MLILFAVEILETQHLILEQSLAMLGNSNVGLMPFI